MKILKHRAWILALAISGVLGACGSEAPSYREVAPAPRRLVMWLGSAGLDASAAERLQSAGVDEVVVRLGSVDLSGQAPLLRFDSVGTVEGPIPVGIALEVSGVRFGLDEEAAEAVWRGIETELAASIPAEVVLDLPRMVEGLDDFVASLSEVSGIPVVPILSFEQLRSEEGLAVARAARVCIVPAFGSDGAGLRGIGELDPLPLWKKLEPLSATGVRIRPAIVLRPRTEPPLSGPGEDLDTLTENQTTTVSTSSVLDRTFTFNQAATWSGRSWNRGDSVAVRWMDVSKVHAALEEIQRLVLPEVAGWDLIPVPAEEQSLGMTREGLLRYLMGEGPEPDLRVEVERNGRSLRLRVTNPSPFGTAVSRFGNWVQVSVSEGWLQARDTGSFEQKSLGLLQGEKLQQSNLDRVNAVRFQEFYLAPGEEVVSGAVRVPSSGTEITVRWHFTLASGTIISGEVMR